MALEFQVVPGSPVPIYRQLVDQVRKAVSRGQLREGDQLPSVRALAEQLLINANTVAKAYSELTRDGILETQAGRGVFAARKRAIFSDEERKRRFSAALDQFLLEALFLDFGGDDILGSVKRRLRELQTTTA